MLRRVYVAGTLWIDYGQDAANANLRSALWRLKRLPYALVDTTATELGLAPTVLVDLHEALAIARRVPTLGARCQEDERDRIVAAREVLPDWYDDWVVLQRERFRQARLHALEALCCALAREGHYARAIETGLAAVADEPLRESAHRAVIGVHLAEGNRWDALRQYELCRRSLRGIGLEPDAETEGLRQQCGCRKDVLMTIH
jgi:DNA-binding SARP family transcriptional activator